MKAKLMLLASAAFALILTSCGGDSSKPETVVEKYYTHLSKGEFDKAKKYMVEEHQNMCDLLSSFTDEATKEKMAKTDVQVKDIKCEVEEDNAVCTCEVVTKFEGKEESAKETVKMKKVDGKWYVNQGKEGMGGEDDVALEDEILSGLEEAVEADTETAVE
ncbi:MAG TPA: DUF4878 domain-containing protein [Bacteroidales bacterium]|jgi:hypothetical protein|nr:DUF4878 domain-containing protein [Bacteroidales bacterium]HOF15297.1 DUF4878 domain-containing protein [Bacteroidales bacterium]HON20046.1 DUF4878 domain-containing protein [Bacteroidales bacterium]HOR81061.1 DUF4878 domain-containing protein [Bacteroidales bacterium]HPJ91116.1 DUF4878 domain-containing protein [Bacteroidales bacterium]